MKKIYSKKSILALFSCLIFVTSCTYQNFKTWEKACLNLPSYIQCTKNNRRPLQGALSFEAFSNVSNQFFALMNNSSYSYTQEENWLYKQKPLHSDTTDTFFVQKSILPDKSQIAVRGDLHGDIHSLLLYIKNLTDLGYLSQDDPFKIIKKDFYMLFLGDYVDRGFYGLEVIYTLMRLKIANPDQVILIRGNHEDISLNTNYGFTQEIKTRFSQNSIQVLQDLQKLYTYLPIALYLGSSNNNYNNYIVCCHGGLEPSYDPRELLSYSFENKTSYQIFSPLNIPATTYNGFMWSDFVVNSQAPSTFDFSSGRNAFGKKDTLALLARDSTEQNRIVGVFRGHQHAGEMTDMMACILDPQNKTDHKGVGKLWKDACNCNKQLWDGIVCTFLVSPNSCYSQLGKLFDFDAFGILTLAPTLDSWKFDVHRIPLTHL